MNGTDTSIHSLSSLLSSGWATNMSPEPAQPPDGSPLPPGSQGHLLQKIRSCIPFFFSEGPSAHVPQSLCTCSSVCLKCPYDRPSHRWASCGSLCPTVTLRGSLPAPCLLSCVVSTSDLLGGPSLSYEVSTLSGVQAPPPPTPAQKARWICLLPHPL